MPAPRIPYSMPMRTTEWQLDVGAALLESLNARRSCRDFAPTPVDRRVIEQVLAIANTAPSGANRKPWRFVVIDDPAIKREIRVAAEAEERESYDHRMPDEWLEALEPLGTDWQKPFLEIAPYLIVVFRVDFEIVDGKRLKTYYPVESCGLACGMLLAACQAVGLATLTHTPSPMGFLREICRRPESERPYLLIPVGYPASDATVPDIVRKPIGERMQWNR